MPSVQRHRTNGPYPGPDGTIAVHCPYLSYRVKAAPPRGSGRGKARSTERTGPEAGNEADSRCGAWWRADGKTMRRGPDDPVPPAPGRLSFPGFGGLRHSRRKDEKYSASMLANSNNSSVSSLPGRMFPETKGPAHRRPGQLVHGKVSRRSHAAVASRVASGCFFRTYGAGQPPPTTRCSWRARRESNPGQPD